MRRTERSRQQVLRGVRGGDRHQRGPARPGRRHAIDRAPSRVDPVRRPRRLDQPRGGPRPGGGPRPAVPLLRDRPGDDRALRRSRREVHRRRRDGGLGNAGGARGRRRARGPGGAGAARGGRDPRRGRRRRPQCPRRSPHRRGRRDGRRRLAGDRGRRPGEHGLAAPVDGRARHRPRRGDDGPGDRPRDRVREVRRPHVEGQRGGRSRVARAPRPRRASRCRPRRGDRAPVRRSRRRAPLDQGARPRDRRRTEGPAPLGHRDRRRRQVASRVGAAEVDRRVRGGALLASRPMPVLRRRRHVLGPGRDGPDAGRDRRDRRPGHVTAQALGVGGGVRLRPRRATMDRAEARAPARARPRSARRPRGAVRRVAGVLRADRGAGYRRDGLRGPPVGRRGVARLHRVDARVVEEPSDPDRLDGETRAL